LCKFDIFTLICKSAIEIFLLSFPFWTFFWLITKRFELYISNSLDRV
jgi:hypothetical protein